MRLLAHLLVSLHDRLRWGRHERVDRQLLAGAVHRALAEKVEPESGVLA
jgi:hypothetical protein